MARQRAASIVFCAFVLASAGAAFSKAARPAPPLPTPGPIAASALNQYPIKTPQSGARFITTGPDGALWFSEASADKIGRMATDGSVTEYPLHGGAYPNGITTGPDGNLWFTESTAGRIAVMTPKGVVKEYRLPISYSGPLGIVAGPDRNIWFTEYVVDKIGRITPDGKITEFSLPAIPAPAASQAAAGPPTPKGPTEITVGPDSNLWFAEQNYNQIGRITPDGSITEFPLFGENNYPNSIVTGPDHNLWFTEGGTGRIGRMTVTGKLANYTIPTRHSGPSGISVGPDGNVWFTETNVNQIAKISITTARITELSLPSADNSGPFSISAGPDKALWFVEQQANKIARYAP